ncbi:MAG TPA: hypothetical protein PKM73_15040 [Verrucomicrobiota bacterium]|nr:hypothetical protein [Verrucomicrobiota bacterium]HNU49322.1 hypothetical protein [Verrucomicrobiota bacterium]
MTSDGSAGGRGRHLTLDQIRKGLQAVCLGAMVAGFVTLGALGYQGWKLFHNPYRAERVRSGAPSLEAADWAAEVYRLEKRAHLVFTGLFEVGLVALSTGAWFAYRRVDRHLQELRRPPKTDDPREPSGKKPVSR